MAGQASDREASLEPHLPNDLNEWSRDGRGEKLEPPILHPEKSGDEDGEDETW